MSDFFIVDSRVHLWDPARLRYPWLDGLLPLNRAFLPDDFSAASANLKLSKFIQDFASHASATDRAGLFQTNAERIYRV
jgi:L-fuconolactonase